MKSKNKKFITNKYTLDYYRTFTKYHTSDYVLDHF